MGDSNAAYVLISEIIGPTKQHMLCALFNCHQAYQRFIDLTRTTQLELSKKASNRLFLMIRVV